MIIVSSQKPSMFFYGVKHCESFFSARVSYDNCQNITVQVGELC